MHDSRELIERRIQRVLTERMRPAVHRTVAPLTVTAWPVDGGQGEPVPPTVALAGTDYQPFAVGQPWGPAWGTTWFHLTGAVPDDVALRAGDTLELVVDLGWADHSPGFQAEGLVYRPDGTAIKGLHPMNAWVPVEADRVEVFVEAAANPLVLEVHPFSPTAKGEKSTAGTDPIYRLVRADIAVRQHEVAELVADVEVLDGLMRTLAETDNRRVEILLALERALDVLDLFDIAGTAGRARAELAPALAVPAYPGAHRISAVGHAHIDSAWLWPVRETIRKVARTCSNVVQLLDSEPDLVYAMSSAQQFAWIQQHRPEVFARVAEHVRGGRFVPVGGMWVESDTNMVGGEAMARQFVLGQGYFAAQFGMHCTEVWLPDSFGYSAALPQIVALAGIRRFLTQKISWNQRNKFPHHSFRWEGIDGTRVFTHFPPVDTYNSDLSGPELAHAAANFRDKGATNVSLAPFGFGDGGGGPTREMLARARRTRDLGGSPRVEIEPPAAFFDRAVADYPQPPVWVGELYLELHRGTYTSQARTKSGNRRSEHLLREAELWAATAAVRGLADYPYDELTRIWQVVLLQQFHDILPGSSIAWVHREAAANYAAVAADLERLIDTATAALAGEGELRLRFNAAPFTQDRVPPLAASVPDPPGPPTSMTDVGSDLVLDNGILRVAIDDRGLVSSIRDLAADREVVPAGTVANLLQLHPDLPAQWDAWDVDAYYRNTVVDLVELDALTTAIDDEGAATVTVRRSFGRSTVTQSISLRPGARQLDCTVDVDWHEQEKILKAALPVDVHTDRAAYEIQFGHLYRPTHSNTSWDAARFEVCAHRFVHLAEPGYGVAAVNEATYGHDVTRHEKPTGGTYSTIRLSLLRGPRFPDPQTDQGRHERRYALLPGADMLDAVAAGYAINLGRRERTGGRLVGPLLGISGDRSVVVEAVKLAEDRSGDVVVRLYEAAGSRARATIWASFAASAVTEVNLLEEPIGDVPQHRGVIRAGSDSAEISLRPFQIVTLRFAR